MYKLLLIWRYLLTRRIALLSILGVMLGVAIMTIVNAVMLGFSREMETRIHGALSDVTISSRSTLRGFDDVDARMRDAERLAGDMIEAMTPTVATIGLMSYSFGSEVISRPVQIVGIDPASNQRVTEISKCLQHPLNREKVSFELREDGYDVVNPLFGTDGIVRHKLADAGWKKRRADAKYEKYRWKEQRRRREMEIYGQMRKPDSAPELDDSELADDEQSSENAYDSALANLPTAPVYDEEGEATPENADLATTDPVPTPSDAFPNLDSELASDPESSDDDHVADASLDSFDDSPRTPDSIEGTPFDGLKQFETVKDKEFTQETGAILGVGLVSGARRKFLNPDTGKEEIRETMTIVPGSDVVLSFTAIGSEGALPTSFVYDEFTVVDLYECHMTEYDDSFVFVPIDKLQEMRRMIAPNGTKMATQILIKAKPGVKIEDLRDRLRDSEEFPEQLFEVETWKDQQATTLAAVATELSLLNVVLFLAMGGAGFCILAIFYMIVSDKTRDVGIMKSLGASGSGIMQIFVFYALALGIVGMILGMIAAFVFVAHIQEIADFLSRMMGHEVFDPSIYMFSRVPAIIEPTTVFWIDVSALFVAVAASVFPALRAARLKPVDALRV